MKLTRQDLATILAALRFYQENGQGDPKNRSDAIHYIATACDEVISLDADGIDELCLELNRGMKSDLDDSKKLQNVTVTLRVAVTGTVQQTVETDNPDGAALLAIDRLVDGMTPGEVVEHMSAITVSCVQD